ncbi:hypothetical protein [Granulosicoccus antarcticus]|uniref:Uncharacterized protein n=1 Tax=Granulosicoccus antarcticus IMCC3135 TaxID=1192854 RepID=A0A2Z2NYI6_9GAMM|nr:hypothetical protein [Granulosicoccus antarcticus]ASJ74991.1 hypothetical protein IMCC3135_24625 [Granulosicoccus antarcticus IMCC3135]
MNRLVEPSLNLVIPADDGLMQIKLVSDAEASDDTTPLLRSSLRMSPGGKLQARVRTIKWLMNVRRY